MNQTISCIIADEELSGKFLTGMLRENFPFIEISACCNSPEEAWNSVVRYNPVLVFLGIEMNSGNGFDFLKMFREIPFQFIMLSHIKDHAVEAFRYSAADYLLKPVQSGELREAVNKVVHELTLRGIVHGSPASNHSGQGTSSGNGNLVIPHSKGFTVVKSDDIILCEAEGYCTSFYLKGNMKISSSQNLKHYEAKLPAGRFMRVHNSFIINLEHVRGYAYNGEITLSEELKCTLSAGRRKEFLAAFGKMK